MKTVLLLIGFILCSIDLAEAQQPKVARIGFLNASSYSPVDAMSIVDQLLSR